MKKIFTISGSVLGGIIVLAIIAFGIFVLLQIVPFKIFYILLVANIYKTISIYLLYIWQSYLS